MCAIIEWAGKLPKGLLTNLLVQSETRGRDSTGVAYRVLDDAGKPSTLCYRQIVPARTFCDLHKQFMGDARRSFRGIAHTRRASPGMPVDNTNAHPYAFPYGSLGKFMFAHNGRIENWREIKDRCLTRYKAALDEMIQSVLLPTGVSYEVAVNQVETDTISSAVSEVQAKELRRAHARLRYVENATTDSMLLGPSIEDRDFSSLVGCMSVVWMRSDKVYVYRVAKEAVATSLVWKYTKKVENEPDDDQVVTVVTSTPEIMLDSITRVQGIEFSYSFTELSEGEVYQLTPGAVVAEGAVPSPSAVEDAYTSAVVEDKNGAPIELFE